MPAVLRRGTQPSRNSVLDGLLARLRDLDAQLAAEQLGALSLATADVSLVSHAHGRARREERGITRAELQAAVKHGRKERAHAGRDGAQRWRFTHNGVVYITDATCRHEITSWRLADAAGGEETAPPSTRAAAGGESHTVLVVDVSGSMRTRDVPGQASRAAAVYNCLAHEFVQPQLELAAAHGAGVVQAAVVTLIEMSDGADVLLSRAPLDEWLLLFMQQRAHECSPRSHGNYLPSLDAALAALRPSRGANAGQLLLLFLSDGAPSDHTQRACAHGVQVWQPLDARRHGRAGRVPLQACCSPADCRSALRADVAHECAALVARIGDVCGRDRVRVHTIAFGPPAEDYAVLRDMASGLPRSTFQKLGLAVTGLSSAFSALNSTLTSLRTHTAGGAGASGGSLTRRFNAVVAPGARASDADEDSNNWSVSLWQHAVPELQGYGSFSVIVRKYKFDAARRDFVSVPLCAGANALAQYAHAFAEGAERIVYRCNEACVRPKPSWPGDALFKRLGARFVAKQSLYTEHLHSARFHETLAATQAEAQVYAARFNVRVRGPPEWQLNFVGTHIYELVTPTGVMRWISAEPELEGAFTKWNNNAGAVRGARGGGADTHLGAIHESDESDESDDEYHSGVRNEDVPQCFSHYTWSVSDGQLLVCDLQGVWNATDGFTLTDPAMHRVPAGGRRRRGSTDKGERGIAAFFATHTCSGLCAQLGLRAFNG